MNNQFFNVFKGFTIFLCQIHLPLENKSMFLPPKVSFSVLFFEFPCFNYKHEQYAISVLFFSLKLHKLPYLNLFIGFNNILKKIPFSCYIKCNRRYFNEKIYTSLRKRIFQFFFLFISMFWMKMKEKPRNILNFYSNSFFSLKNT